MSKDYDSMSKKLLQEELLRIGLPTYPRKTAWQLRVILRNYDVHEVISRLAKEAGRSRNN